MVQWASGEQAICVRDQRTVSQGRWRPNRDQCVPGGHHTSHGRHFHRERVIGKWKGHRENLNNPVCVLLHRHPTIIEFSYFGPLHLTVDCMTCYRGRKVFGESIWTTHDIGTSTKMRLSEQWMNVHPTRFSRTLFVKHFDTPVWIDKRIIIWFWTSENSRDPPINPINQTILDSLAKKSEISEREESVLYEKITTNYYCCLSWGKTKNTKSWRKKNIINIVKDRKINSLANYIKSQNI